MTSQDDMASAEALAAGGLPGVAQRRLAELGASGAFTSDLSVAEFETVRSVGFQPVGQVQGSSVYQIGFSGWGWCGAQAYGTGFAMGYQPVAAADAFAPLVNSLRTLRHTAMERARAEAAALGGDGVVGVQLTMRPFPGALNTMEFQAIGTAVRAIGRVHAPRPFLSDLSGQDFAKLIAAGWVPVDLVMGVAVEISHDSYQTRATRSPFNQANAEIAGYTELVMRTRAAARGDLHRDLARVGGEAAVVAGIDLRMHEQECRAVGAGGTDHIGESFVVGTAIARFRSTATKPPRTLAVLPVGGARAGRKETR